MQPSKASLGRDTRAKRYTPAATMAISTPLRTPRPMTPSIAISANRKSARLVCHSRRSSLASKRSITAEAMTAPNAATGRYSITSVSATSTKVNAAAATSPATCVRPPTASLIAVRESAPLTGKPPNNPEAMFAAPKPISSRLALTRYRFLAPKLRAVTMPLPKTDDKDAEGVLHQVVKLDPCRYPQCQTGQDCRDLSDRGDASRFEIEEERQQCGDNYRDEGTRRARRPPFKQPQ